MNEKLQSGYPNSGLRFESKSSVLSRSHNGFSVALDISFTVILFLISAVGSLVITGSLLGSVYTLGCGHHTTPVSVIIHNHLICACDRNYKEAMVAISMLG
jgi:hypothetical protein